MTKLYLAGPMSGVEDLNRPAFDAAARRLRDAGVHVVSPVDLSIELAGSWRAAKASNDAAHEAFVARDLVEVAACDGVVFLPGWESSRGARAEAREALRLGLTFRLYDATRTPPWEDLSASTVDHEVNGTRLAGVSISRPGEYIDVTNQSSPYDGARFVPFEENPERHVFGSGGIKDNRGKARVDLVPSRPILAVAEILAFGAKKYRPHNWRRGLPWPDTYSSLQRHLLAWNDGEDLDKETGKSHLAHAACQLLFLLDYSITGVGEDTDTRFIPCRVEGCDAQLHPTTDHQHLKETA